MKGQVGTGQINCTRPGRCFVRPAGGGLCAGRDEAQSLAAAPLPVVRRLAVLRRAGSVVSMMRRAIF